MKQSYDKCVLQSELHRHAAAFVAKGAGAFLAVAVCFAMLAPAQAQNGYKIAFNSPSLADGTYYIGQHFRDKYVVRDSSTAKNNALLFNQKTAHMPKGVYTLLDSMKSKMFDFMVDDSRNFTISFDAQHSNAGMQVKGSAANTAMYAYMANWIGPKPVRRTSTPG